MYVDVKTDGSPPPSPRTAEAPLRPLAAASHDYDETPLAGSSTSIRSPTEKPLARLGRTALLVAVPAVVLLVAAAVLLAVVTGSGPGGRLFSGAPHDYDVLVVGAGAAGLAAAKQLREQGGLKVRTLSVTERYTDTLVSQWRLYDGDPRAHIFARAALRDPLAGSLWHATMPQAFWEQSLQATPAWVLVHRSVSRVAHEAQMGTVLILVPPTLLSCNQPAALSGGCGGGFAPGRRARAHVAGAGRPGGRHRRAVDRE